MSGTRDVDELLARASLAQPAALDAEASAAMVAGAEHAAAQRSWRRRSTVAASTLAFAAAIGLVLLVRAPASDSASSAVAGWSTSASAGPRATTETPRRAAMRERVLASGDRIVERAGASYRVAFDAATRRVFLHRGALLFSVVEDPRRPFVVVTPHGTAVVLGTVFSVEVSASSIRVEVFEGRVEVRSPERRVIAAGERFGAGSLEPTDADLRSRGRELAAARVAAVAPAPIALEAPVASRESPPPRRAATPARARRWILEGRPARALREARRARVEGRGPPWAMIEAEALRASGRPREAAEAYRRAGARADRVTRAHAGFLEGRLWAELGRNVAVLDALERGRVTQPGSPLRERGLALRVRALGRLGRTAEQVSEARAYLLNFPDGLAAPAMRLLTR